MLGRKVRSVGRDKPLVFGVAILIFGQLLFSLFDFGALFVISALYVLAIGLPYPSIVRSKLARTIMAVLLFFAFVQAAAMVQFFVAPNSKFGTLSFIVTLLILLAVFVTYRWRSNQKTPWFEKKDYAALLAAALFVVPFALWVATPDRMVSFGGRQSPDGASHSINIDQQVGVQHLSYRTDYKYYPKGFHIVEAMILRSFHLQIHENAWLTNMYTYMAQYVVWGFIAAFTLFYLAHWLAELVLKKLNMRSKLLLAVMVGSALSLFYLLPFAQEGFLNYYYVCAAFILSLLFVPSFMLRKKEDYWFVTAYFLSAFSIGMSWGPLLMPVMMVTPILAILLTSPSFKHFKDQLWQQKYLLVLAGYLLLAVPLLIHFTYSHETSFNAEGSIRTFNIGLVILGVGLLGWAAFGSKLNQEAKQIITSVFWPFVVLVGAMAAAQYVTVGEARYYTIKTSYLFEMLVIVVAAVLMLWWVLAQKSNELQRWLMTLVVFCIGLFAVMTIGGNPLTSVRALLNRPIFLQSDTQKIAEIGLENKLHGHNVAVLHYNATEDKIFGNQLIANWANSLATVNDGSQASADCNDIVFSILAYGVDAGPNQAKLKNALATCMTIREKQNKPYYIITDPESQPYLKRILGDKAIFL